MRSSGSDVLSALLVSLDRSQALKKTQNVTVEFTACFDLVRTMTPGLLFRNKWVHSIIKVRTII